MNLAFLNNNLSPKLRVINFAYNNSNYYYPISQNFIPDPSSGIKNVQTNSTPAFCFFGKHVSDMISFCVYKQGYIVCHRTYGRYVCVSFEFSGCYMARFKYDGIYYYCHIFRQSNSSGDCKNLWNNFLSNHYQHISDIVIFRPNIERIKNKLRWISTNSMAHYSICGIIDTNNDCYAAIIEHETSKFMFLDKISRGTFHDQNNTVCYVHGPLNNENRYRVMFGI